MKTRLVLAAALMLVSIPLAAAAPDQPFMQAARTDLQTAKRELQRATPDKRSHRVKAISLVNQAIAQVNAGIAYEAKPQNDVG